LHFSFLLKSHDNLYEKIKSILSCLVNSWVRMLFSTAGTIPKYDEVVRTLFKESSKILKYSNGM